ncbi:MAG: type II toxin-antitoxin system RelE/ParE family toxin [Desulfobacterales bacterium]|nr:type II toxin-antitoxin system RelE/ParE family toxin [Desulfobacterales bacterium]
MSNCNVPNPSAAVRFRERAEKTLKRLLQYPESGRHISEFPELPHREVVVASYRFFYRAEGGSNLVEAAPHRNDTPLT